MPVIFSRVDRRTKEEFSRACQITRKSESETVAEFAHKHSRKILKEQTSHFSSSKKAGFLEAEGYKDKN